MDGGMGRGWLGGETDDIWVDRKGGPERRKRRKEERKGSRVGKKEGTSQNMGHCHYRCLLVPQQELLPGAGRGRK